MAGTTNTDDWGTDETGLRRFWPVRCGDIALELLAAHREQLFAEAVAAVQAGALWWEMPDSTQGIQAERQHHDEWTEPILAWCAIQPTDDGISIKDALLGAIKLSLDRIDKSAQMRAAKILKIAKWNRRKARIGSENSWRWFVPTSGGNISEGGNKNEAEF